MFLEQYTALALVFASKTIARREDMSKNSLFFLAGTMVNVTYSIMIGLVVMLLIGII
jgi:tetrahydromethanopterin S-methyltransferase subunit B